MSIRSWWQSARWPRITRSGRNRSRSYLDLFLDRGGIEVVPVDADQAREARLGHSRFGKGRHSAGLNFGECFSYALAITAGEPLLFKGADFDVTDIVPAV